jgi:transposase-like protein
MWVVMAQDMREVRGKAIAQLSDQIQKMNPVKYRVKSQSGNGFYDVISTRSGWKCTCPDHVYREVECKHIWAVRFSFAIRREVEANIIEPISDIHACIYCHSDSLIRFGLRHNKYGDLQKFSCKSCGKYFTINVGFEKMRATPQAITAAMQLYFTGESLRNTSKALKLIGVQVSHKTVFMWIKKYTALMEKYLEKITPQVSDVWRADEMSVKVKGNLKWLFALIDDETRFWIAKEVANSKFDHDTKPLFRMSKEIAGKKPRILITDGLMTYHAGYMKEFYTHKLETRTEHIRHITVQGDHNNNKMERFNGEVRDREKVVRGLKKPDSPLLDGYQIYHNYIRPHEALDGETPADRCGIRILGENKWLTIIQNAVRVEN